MTIEYHASDQLPEAAVLSFSGSVTVDQLEHISRTVDEAIEKGHSYIIGEMSKVSEISSSVVGKLMECRTRLVALEGDFVLAGLNLDCRETLVAMEANKIFRMFSDVRNAMNSYAWGTGKRVERIAVEFPPELRFVPPIRSLASRVAAQKGYGKKDAFRIEAIVDEICNNAVEHGKVDSDQAVDFTISIDRGKVELNVMNTSDPDKVDLLKELVKSLEAGHQTGGSEMRGRGIALVRMLADNFQVEYSDRGTSVNVTKIREE